MNNEWCPTNGINQSDYTPDQIEDVPNIDDSSKPENSSAKSPPLQIDKLTKILRIIGAAVLIASASIFLFQHWQSGNDIQRYLALLTHTALLPIAAFFCGLRIYEKKGARTLLALTLAIIPIHYAVLSALIYSQWAVDTTSAIAPNFALWIAPSPAAAVIVTIAAIALLLPLSAVSVLSLARIEVKLITLIYFCTNLLLLIPIRQSEMVAPLIFLTVVGLSIFEIRKWQNFSELKTFEGRWVRTALWIPVVIMVARTLHIYDLSLFFSSALWASVSVLLFVMAPGLFQSRQSQLASQSFSTIAASISWYMLVVEIACQMNIRDDAILPLVGIPFAVILWVMSMYCIDEGAGYRRMAAICAMSAVAINLFVLPSTLSSFSCLIVAVAGLTFGYLVEQKLIFAAGIVSASLALGYHIRFAILHYSLPYWVALSLLGIAIILMASVIERHIEALIARARQIHNQLRRWEN